MKASSPRSHIIERGQGLVAYALLLGLVGIVAVAALSLLGTSLADRYCEIAASLDSNLLSNDTCIATTTAVANVLDNNSDQENAANETADDSASQPADTQTSDDTNSTASDPQAGDDSQGDNVSGTPGNQGQGVGQGNSNNDNNNRDKTKETGQDKSKDN